MTSVANVARHLTDRAREAPDRPALHSPIRRSLNGRIVHRTLSFAELEAFSNRLASSFQNRGLSRGARVLLMVRPGLELVGISFALFKSGAVPVVIDPGMGRDNVLACVKRTQPDALIGIGLAHALALFHRAIFASVRFRVTVGRRWGWSGPTLAQCLAEGSPECPIAPTQPDDLAAILFTSGSTGPAKGVCYLHRMFEAQVDLLRATFGIQSGEIDLAMLPVFALFNPALGMTTVLPRLNPSRPARANPADLVQAIQQHNATNTFGSPVIWNRIADHCESRRIQLPSLRRVLMAGCPVPPALVARVTALAPNAAVHTPYGATECLPVTTIESRDILELRSHTESGHGTCIGRPAAGMSVRIVRLGNDPIPAWRPGLAMGAGDVGEIVVSGPVVTESYDHMPEATRLAKIWDGTRIWHRTGDAGYLDDSGRLWFAGRVAHRVDTAEGTLFSDFCEPIFNQHPAVRRSALIALPSGERRSEPAIVVELQPRASIAPRTLVQQLRALAAGHPGTREIRRFFRHRHFPVDVRHNAKIDRPQLAAWAATAPGRRAELLG